MDGFFYLSHNINVNQVVVHCSYLNSDLEDIGYNFKIARSQMSAKANITRELKLNDLLMKGMFFNKAWARFECRICKINIEDTDTHKANRHLTTASHRQKLHEL